MLYGEPFVYKLKYQLQFTEIWNSSHVTTIYLVSYKIVIILQFLNIRNKLNFDERDQVNLRSKNDNSNFPNDYANWQNPNGSLAQKKIIE